MQAVGIGLRNWEWLALYLHIAKPTTLIVISDIDDAILW